MSRSDLIVAGKPPFTFTTPDGRTAKFADFTWNAFKPGKQHFAQGDEVAQKAHESGMIGFDNILKYRFRTQRDIALCDSMTIGSTQVTVWASGRITEGKHGGKSSDDNPLGEAQPREIAPRYDFLR